MPKPRSLRTQRGCRTRNKLAQRNANVLERTTRDGESPVAVRVGKWASILSTTRHVKPCGKLGGPPSKADYSLRPIVNQYREGKVKSTPKGG